jgi:hypothetical protein
MSGAISGNKAPHIALLIRATTQLFSEAVPMFNGFASPIDRQQTCADVAME